MKISKHTWWLLGASVIAALSQLVFFAIGSSIGELVWKLMVRSLLLIDQKVLPTLWFDRGGWPLPTWFGLAVYLIISVAIIFFLLWGVSTLMGRKAKISNSELEDKP